MKNMGASSSTTGLAGAEAPEPHSRLGPSDGIPSAYKLLDDPAGQAAFMLPRLDAAQRAFILAVKPTLKSQRIARKLFDSAWPGVQTGEEWPDQFWFGGGCAHYPAGRRPIGTKRCSYSFCFNQAGLLLRELLATPKVQQ